MFKKIINLSSILVFILFFLSTISVVAKAQELHADDLQPWRIGAEIFVNSNFFETDFGDLPGGLFVTDEPGVDVNVAKGTFTPGNWLQFKPVGQLYYWNGNEWTLTAPNGERVEIKDALGSTISIGTDGVNEASAVIGEINNEGGLHEHLDFSIVDASNALNGSVGAYGIQLKLFETKANSDISVSIATTPITIVFNRGLENEKFELAASTATSLNNHSVFFADTGILTIQKVKALGTYYKVKLQQIGNDQFQLIEAEETSRME